MFSYMSSVEQHPVSPHSFLFVCLFVIESMKYQRNEVFGNNTMYLFRQEWSFSPPPVFEGLAPASQANVKKCFWPKQVGCGRCRAARLHNHPTPPPPSSLQRRPWVDLWQEVFFLSAVCDIPVKWTERVFVILQCFIVTWQCRWALAQSWWASSSGRAVTLSAWVSHWWTKIWTLFLN